MDTQNRASRRAATLEKVRKLLSMARDGRGNETERETAMRQANKLMAAFGIEEAEADLSALDSGEMIFGEAKCGPDGAAPQPGRIYRTFPAWCGILAVGVARFTDSVVVRRTTEIGQTLVFQGEREDVLFARWLLACLVASINRERKESGWTARGDAESFNRAAASKLAARLKELTRERRAAYEAARAASSSRALVLVDRKAAVILDKFGQQRTRASRASSGCSSGAYQAGSVAGARINISANRPLTGASAHAALAA